VHALCTLKKCQEDAGSCMHAAWSSSSMVLCLLSFHTVVVWWCGGVCVMFATSVTFLRFFLVFLFLQVSFLFLPAIFIMICPLAALTEIQNHPNSACWTAAAQND